MTHDSSRTIVSRRQLMIGGAMVASGLGLGLASVWSDRVAAVSVDEFEVQGGTFERESVEPAVDVVVAYEYALETPPDELRVYLTVAGDPVAQETIGASSASESGSVGLQGSVLESSAWSKSDFAVEDGRVETRELNVGVRFRVRRDGAVVAEAEASDTTTVEVRSPNEFTTVVLVGGSGEIVAGSG